MTGRLKMFTLCAGLLATAPLAQPADAATVRRHIDCYAFAIGVGGLLGPPNPVGTAVLTNNWSFTIPAGTTFSLRVEGRQLSYQSDAALPPGGHASMSMAVQTNGACDASYPDTGFGNANRVKQLNQGLKLQRAP